MQATKKAILERLFGKSQSHGGKKAGGNRDFDFYRKILEQLLDFWNPGAEQSMEQVRRTVEKGLSKKRRQEDEDGTGASKRRKLGEE